MRDLHLHLDGSLSPATMKKISEETGIKLPENYESMVKYDAQSGTLRDYLKCFSLPVSLMQSLNSVRYSVMTLLEDLKEDGADYAEIRFAPQFHTESGLSQLEIVQAAIEGLEYAPYIDMDAKLILCLMRGCPDEANRETLNCAEKLLGKGVCAIDLAGSEADYPVTMYTDFFEYAKKKGIPFTIHAGEAAGPESIENALRLGASRIGHGIAAKDDPELMRYLAKHKIPLEMCPTSNIQTGAVKDFEGEYPLRKFLDAGIIATINTDNRTVSDTTLKKEFELVRTLPGIGDNELKILERNAELASF